jgi:site-specific recombinase XerD
MSNDLVIRSQQELPARPQEPLPGFPGLVESSGPAARFAWDEFIHGSIANDHTKRSYGNCVRRFLDDCQFRGLELHRIAPKDVRLYLKELRHQRNGERLSIASRKLHLAAIRHFFDIAVVRHAVVLNPAASVRGEKYKVHEGKTPEIGVKQAERLLGSIDTSHVVGLRDRAAIAVMIYTAARVGAIANLKKKDFYHNGEQWMLHFTEKNGNSREIPVRHDLEQFISNYLGTAGTTDENAPLFRSAYRKTKQLTANPMTTDDLRCMLKRRLKQTGLSTKLSPHSFRVTTATDLLTQGVPLEDVQFLLGHSDARTTKLYSRVPQKVTRNIVERISVRSDKTFP